MVDYDHRSHFSAAKGGSQIAAGWVEKLVIISGKIWAHIEWTERARQLINAKEYRYISPEFWVQGATREIVKIVALALVNRPALKMAELAKAQNAGINVELSKTEKHVCDRIGIDHQNFAVEKAQQL